ncbi:MAG: NAD-dependent epimerase/dehydratase family protein [Chthoniobacteraceae bacterium]
MFSKLPSSVSFRVFRGHLIAIFRMNIEGAKVVVTGGAGFIGSELTRQLCEARAEVCVLDNLVNGSEENLAAIAESAAPRPRLIRGDVRDAAALCDVLRGCDVVFHLACLGVRHSLLLPLENHDVNATGTLRVLEAAHAAGVRRFVHVSTSEVYGSAQTVPMTEDHPTRPSTVYGASKLAGESYARAFFATHGLPVTVVRPFNAFGPRCHHEGDRGEVIPRFLLRTLAGRELVIFGDGAQTRDFTFVEDTARGILLAACADAAIGGTFNLGSGRETAIREVAEAVARALDLPPPAIRHTAPRPGDVRRLIADSTLAARVLDYAPRVTFDDGLRQLAAWYRRCGGPPEKRLESEIERSWEAATA